MKTCVIFNPAARGQKAERLRARLGVITRHAVLKKTAAAGDARRLAAEAVAEGYDTVVAAGGDGTVNEVLNGIADANAFDRVRLGVLPLGTINVFALEMGIPFHPSKAWKVILRGRYTRIDLGWAEFSAGGAAATLASRKSEPQAEVKGSETEGLLSPARSSLGEGAGEKSAATTSSPVPLERRHFVQIGGAGLDARAIELVDWQQKTVVGPLAYVVAGLKALREPQPKIIVTANGYSSKGELVLIGNGKYYGGRMKVFPAAHLRDGMLNVCVFPRVKAISAVLHLLYAAVFRRLPKGGVRRMRTAKLTLTAEHGAGFELDGEWVGELPATFGVEQEKLRVIVP